MHHAMAVHVLHSFSDITSETYAHKPRQLNGLVGYQLFKAATVDVLTVNSKKCRQSLLLHTMQISHALSLTYQKNNLPHGISNKL
jgi:hypothetical protein